MRSIKLAAAAAAGAALFALAPAGALATPQIRLGHKHASAAGCKIDVIVPRTAVSGASVLVTGVLTCPGGPSEQEVTVYERVAGAGGFKPVGSPKTSPKDGSYSFTPQPVITDSTFYVRAGGARSASKTVHVAPEVTAAVVPTKPEGAELLTGVTNEVTFRGSVTPNDNKAEVWLQREAATSNEEWTTIQMHNFVQADGTFTIVHRFVFPGDANLRVVVRRHGVFDVRAVSSPMSYIITQAQNNKLILEPKANPVAFGSPIEFTGKLVSGASGQKVTLMAQSFGSPTTQVGEATTGTGGTYSITIPSANESALYRAYSGGVHSTGVFVGVRWTLSASALVGGLPATEEPAGTIVTFTGTAAPSRVGHFVYLERKGPGGFSWSPEDVGVIKSEGGKTVYSIPFNVYGPIGSTQYYRIKIPGDPINQGSSSTAIAIKILAPAAGVQPVIQPTLPH